MINEYEFITTSKWMVVTKECFHKKKKKEGKKQKQKNNYMSKW